MHVRTHAFSNLYLIALSGGTFRPYSPNGKVVNSKSPEHVHCGATASKNRQFWPITAATRSACLASISKAGHLRIREKILRAALPLRCMALPLRCQCVTSGCGHCRLAFTASKFAHAGPAHAQLRLRPNQLFRWTGRHHSGPALEMLSRHS